MRWSRNIAAVATIATLVFAACGTSKNTGGQASSPAETVELSVDRIERLLPTNAKPKDEWAQAVWNGLMANSVLPTQTTSCAVIAIIAQESGFKADPTVPGLAKLVRARIESHQDKLPLVGKPLFAKLLSARAPGEALTFDERLSAVRTEGDLDRVFRDLLGHYEANYPTTFAALNLAGRLFDVKSLSELNPITTAGSMQVNVRFAEEFAHKDKGGESERVRDELYTVKGGVFYGTARLFGFKAAYEDPIFRFADYNAGVYASRNAALQAQIGTLIGTKLAWDGDLLAYDSEGVAKDDDSETLRALAAFAVQYAPSLSMRKLRQDVLREKTQDLEKTATYKAIKEAFAKKKGRPPKYAILPEVAISSPKFTSTRSTAWFAEAVDRRYRVCLALTP